MASDDKTRFDDEFVKAYSKHFIVDAISLSHVITDLTPGMKYQVSANFVGVDKKTGPSSSLYITPSTIKFTLF